MMYTALVVDDEAIIRRGILTMIPWAEMGFDAVLEAGSGQAALEMAARQRVDLVITDIYMPGIDGLDMTQSLIAMQPEIRIVVITGYDNFAYAQRCVELGVRKLLLKPFDEEKLTEIVRELAREIGDKPASPPPEDNRALRGLGRMLAALAESGADAETRSRFRDLTGMGRDERAAFGLMAPAGELPQAWRGHDTLYLINTSEMLRDALEKSGAGWCFVDGNAVALLMRGDEQAASVYLQDLCLLAEEEYGGRFVCALGAPAGPLRDVGASYAAARAAIQRELQRATPEGGLARAAIQWIERDYMRDISVAALAEQMHVSPNYFSRLFKQETGQGCGDYITAVRIRQAKRLLRETRMRCYEIAEAVGYRDANYFSLSFKKNVGVSPEQYRIGR